MEESLISCNKVNIYLENCACMNFSVIAGWDYRFREQILRAQCGSSAASSAQQLTRVPAGSFPFSREQREGREGAFSAPAKSEFPQLRQLTQQ